MTADRLPPLGAEPLLQDHELQSDVSGGSTGTLATAVFVQVDQQLEVIHDVAATISVGRAHPTLHARRNRACSASHGPQGQPVDDRLLLEDAAGNYPSGRRSAS